MSLQIERFVTGSYKQNCYIVANDDGEALVIDPGSDAEGIFAIVEKNDWQPLAVIGTHAHFDHVGAVADVMDRYKISFYLNRADQKLLRRMNLFKMAIDSGFALRVPDITYDLAKLPASILIGGIRLVVIATPGHTPGGMSFLIEGNVFTGDTVLPKGTGRTDLPGGDPVALLLSIEKLRGLSSTLVAYPGHGSSMPLGVLLDVAIKRETSRAMRK